MYDYVIFTDTACDISPSILAKWGVKCENMIITFDGEEGQYTSDEITVKDFYNKMRKGSIARTSAVNTETFKLAFEKELQLGKDILYMGFSSGLSTTYNSARLAANELSALYPERKLFAVDTLCASAGQGLLLYLTVQKRNCGATIEEAAKFALDNRLSLCHWFTVDDLVYLKRGGRISSAVAFVGGVLGIKPVLHTDNAGELKNVTKARGRKAAVKALADKYGELAIDPASGTVFISNGDCIDDAKKLAEMLKKTYGVKVQLITDIGPVIGAHSGPGTLALFFLGRER
ncbi:MAG: DegV family protein [Clostridia bacterium]|nr:DegV family protein [Clostridia bacterium]